MTAWQQRMFCGAIAAAFNAWAIRTQTSAGFWWLMAFSFVMGVVYCGAAQERQSNMAALDRLEKSLRKLERKC